jgi:hypothetical protein
LVVLVCVVGSFVVAVRSIHPFLAVNAPVPGGVLVVEGWAPDYALTTVIAEFKRSHQPRLFVTGGPLDKGAPLAAYGNLAELTAASLTRLGLTADMVQAIPAPAVQHDRTYASAVALLDWLHQQGMVETNFNVVTMGPHARRTRLLFQEAMGPGCHVGVIAIQNQGYDPAHWWRSSEGVRTVIGETIAYGYARVFFRPPQ